MSISHETQLRDRITTGMRFCRLILLALLSLFFTFCTAEPELNVTLQDVDRMELSIDKIRNCDENRAGRTQSA